MMAEKVRVDKWLWSVRIFKSRSLATKVCKDGKVTINDRRAKPSSSVEVGDRLKVSKIGYHFQFEVVKLISKRVGAPIAVECYIDHTPEDELRKYENWYIGKGRAEVREKGAGRPTKRERREIDAHKMEMYNFDDWLEEFEE